MPSVPPFTISEAAHTYAAGPVDTFVLRPNSHPPSILDTVFVSKRSRRAVYATTTDAAHETCLWKVRRDGQLAPVAKIGWEYSVQTSNVVGDGSLRNVSGQTKKAIMVSHGGRVMRAGEFLRKGKGWFNSDSKVFSVDEAEYKWKSGNENASTSDGIYARSQSTSYHEMWKIWRCVAASPATSTQPPQITTTDPTSLRALSGGFAREASRNVGTVPSFAASTVPPSTGFHPQLLDDLSSRPPLPPLDVESVPLADESSHRQSFGAAHDTLSPSTSKLGLLHHELALFPPVYASIPAPSSGACASGVDIVSKEVLLENLLLSAILLVTNKGEWKQVKSLADPDALQAVFVAEARGEVPPYTSRVGRVGPPLAGFGSNVSPRTRSRAHSQPLERPRTTERRGEGGGPEPSSQSLFSTIRWRAHRPSRSASGRDHEENRRVEARPSTTESPTLHAAGDGIFVRRPGRAVVLGPNSNLNESGQRHEQVDWKVDDRRLS
ncbi:SubName: Full=Uncharacterized protein {ECO:0000313/EMBL:CCA72962.1} [Serendipita indica DSM 11827]|nr:SubName: Full=Uncharacterized protein {ECO:0000313/EMBL:CCA72962.1} [Serendipita indica DSM 11827]